MNIINRIRNKKYGYVKVITSAFLIYSLLLLSGCEQLYEYAPSLDTPLIDNLIENQSQTNLDETIVTISNENFNKDDFGSYKNNNVTFTVGDIDYEGYYIAPDKDENALFSLNVTDSLDDKASFYNISAFDGMQLININYKCDSEAMLYYGNNRNNLEYATKLPVHEKYMDEEVILIKDVSYFRLVADEDQMHVANMELTCSGLEQDETRTYYANGHHYVPQTNYNPSEGDTLKIPYCSYDEDNGVTFRGYKEYTYHSFEYAVDMIEKKGANPSEYALTDPIDIANYFVLFRKIPANFGAKSDSNGNVKTKMFIQNKVPVIDEVEDVFGSKLARCVQQYTLEDGYAKSVPWNAFDNKDFPVYYEFDYDTDGKYSVYNRGMGRVVGWAAGFSCYEDDNAVALLSDNHYFTFREYSNCGYFNEAFDAMSKGYSGCEYAPGDPVSIE